MAYESVPGTIPHRVIEHLRGLGTGVELSLPELAVVVGLDSARGLKSWLMPAVQGGALAIRVAGPRESYCRLGDGKEHFPEQTDGEPAVTRVAVTAVSSVFAYASERDAAPFSTAESSDGRLILQRHGRVIAELTPSEADIHLGFLAPRIRSRRRRKHEREMAE